MPLRSFLSWALLSGTLLASAGRGHAQALPPAADSTRRPAPLLLKAGLRLTHLHYTRNNQTWQFLLPLSLGAEYRLTPSFSLYGQLEADLLASRTANRRRGQQNALSAAALAVGLRHYYGHYRAAGHPGPVPEFGKYLSLEGAADWQQVTARYLAGTGRRSTPATVVPSLYALWGIQNRLRPYLLYDLNAGLGVLAPAQYYNFEYASGTRHWNVGAQVNIRLYFGT